MSGPVAAAHGLTGELRGIFEALLASTEDARHVSLDALADAIGTARVSPPEIDALITALEAEGRVVGAEASRRASDDLRVVLGAARELRATLGRAPAPAEIARHAGLSDDAVRHALALAKVMQR